MYLKFYLEINFIVLTNLKSIFMSHFKVFIHKEDIFSYIKIDSPCYFFLTRLDQARS